MYRLFTAVPVVIMLVLLSAGNAYATDHPGSIFSDAQRYSDSNSYRNGNYSFSIQPPLNWSVLGNLPPEVSKQALVIFSNNDKSHLATFGIYHRNITPNIMEAINNHTDNDVLATIAQEMSANSSDSSTIVFDGVVDRYNDGVKVSVSSATHYTADNSTTISENIIYFLDNGNQYTLDLTSNMDSIDKNSQLFEDSASTFLASQSAVPEFPVALAALTSGMLSIALIFRVKLLSSQ